MPRLWLILAGDPTRGRLRDPRQGMESFVIWGEDVTTWGTAWMLSVNADSQNLPPGRRPSGK